MPKFAVILEIDAADRTDANHTAEGIADVAQALILLVALSANLEAKEVLS